MTKFSAEGRCTVDGCQRRVASSSVCTVLRRTAESGLARAWTRRMEMNVVRVENECVRASSDGASPSNRESTIRCQLARLGCDGVRTKGVIGS